MQKFTYEIAKIEADTKGLTLAQAGIYHLLVCEYFKTEAPIRHGGPIPGAEATAQCVDISRVLSLFEYRLDGYHLPWIDALLAQARQNISGAGFDDFWKVYPRKDAKKDARKAWLGACAIAIPVNIMIGATRFAETWEGRPKAEVAKFCPLPATWLRGERWNDAGPSSGFDAGAAIRQMRDQEEGVRT